MKNKVVINDDGIKKEYELLLNVKLNSDEYIVYTNHEFNKCEDMVCYVAKYEFIDGLQTLKPVEDVSIVETIDNILLQVQNIANKGRKE